MYVLFMSVFNLRVFYVSVELEFVVAVLFINSPTVTFKSIVESMFKGIFVKL